MQLAVNPASLLIGALSGNFSYAIGDRMALMVPLAVQFLPFSLYTEIDGQGFNAGGNVFSISAGVGVKFFLSADAFESGWYVYPAVEAGYGSRFGYDNFVLTISALGGYGWVWDSGFSLNLGLGLSYSHWFSTQAGALRVYQRYPFPTLELALGYTW